MMNFGLEEIQSLEWLVRETIKNLEKQRNEVIEDIPAAEEAYTHTLLHYGEILVKLQVIISNVLQSKACFQSLPEEERRRVMNYELN